MARRKKHKKRKSTKLQKNTVYTLFAAGLFLVGILLFASFSQSGNALTQVHAYLVSLFGFLGFLIPINCILLALLMTKIKSRFTQANVAVGFLLFSICLLGIAQSGLAGMFLFANLASLIGGILTVILFLFGILVGLIVLLNLSMQQIINGVSAVSHDIAEGFKTKIFPLFKVQKPAYEEQKQITIKGLSQQQSNQNADKQPLVREKKFDEKKSQQDGMTDELILNKPAELGVWEYPPTALLSNHMDKKAERGDVKSTASLIEKTLESFGIKARVVEINLGPSVTQYAIEIALGTKLSKITGLANDLALATEAPTGQVRIEAPIPGRNLVGIEIPNRSLEVVSLKTLLTSPEMQKNKSKLAIPLGLNVSGEPVIADIAKMPHILIAGTTGSGKSVAMNVFISSILFRASPNEVKFILIDPKRVELTGYNDIPHLLTPVVVEADKSVSALKWAMKEMDKRYMKFAEVGVRNIDSYNELSGFQALPYIVIFIDEFADLMALAPAEVEDSITRLAQMARATGIHLVLATQRPSVDVITGLIKANIPCRMAFSVSSMVDSKVILDMPGAEKLLGKGDMLYIPPDQAKPTRIQGAFVSEQDSKRLINFIKARGIPIQYTEEVLEQVVNIKGRGGTSAGGGANGGGDKDELFADAVRIVCQYDKASMSFLQRKLSIGFNRAARIMEQLEQYGVVSPGDGSKPRDVIVTNADEFLAQVG